MTNAWTTGVDRSTSDMPTASEWNAYLGANGNLDYLIGRNWMLQGVDSTDRTTTSGSAVDLCTISDLNIAPQQPILIIGSYRKASGAAVSPQLGLTINATAVMEAVLGTDTLAGFSTTSQNEDGSFWLLIGPRTSSYPCNLIGLFSTRVSATGAVAKAATMTPSSVSYTATIPLVDITTIIIRAITASSNTVAVKDVAVYAGGITL